MQISPKQLEANRLNSLASTGPHTEEGRSKSSRNAVRTGLTGRTILLAADDADAYDTHVTRYACEYNPQGDRETELVQSLADTQWRLNRIPCLEAGFYAAGRLEFADRFADQPEDLRALLIENLTFRTYYRNLSNLSLQESRLRRQYTKDLAELNALQSKRETALNAAKTHPQVLVSTAAAHRNGFEFSNSHPPSHSPQPSSPALPPNPTNPLPTRL